MHEIGLYGDGAFEKKRGGTCEFWVPFLTSLLGLSAPMAVANVAVIVVA